MEDKFSMDERGMAQVVMQLMKSNEGWQMKFHSLVHYSFPPVWPTSFQAVDWYWYHGDPWVKELKSRLTKNGYHKENKRKCSSSQLLLILDFAPRAQIQVKVKASPKKLWLHGTGATPRPRSGAAAERGYPMSKVRSSGEEIPHVQGKRNPSKTIDAERGH